MLKKVNGPLAHNVVGQEDPEEEKNVVEGRNNDVVDIGKSTSRWHSMTMKGRKSYLPFADL